MRNLVIPLVLTLLVLPACGKKDSGSAGGPAAPVITTPPSVNLAQLCTQNQGKMGTHNGVSACEYHATQNINLTGQGQLPLPVNLSVNDIVTVGVVGNVIFFVGGAPQSATTFVSNSTGQLSAVGSGFSITNVRVTRCFDAAGITYAYCNF